MLSKTAMRSNQNVFLLCLALLWCGRPGGASAREIAITLIHTADVHGTLEACPSGNGEARDREQWPELQGKAGGLLRCATLICKIRAQAENVVLVDCGDFFQGSVESFLTRGGVMARAAACLKYDALVVGNHEFDWGADVLRDFYRKAQVPVLCAGLVAPKGEELPFSAPMFVREFEGVRLVVIGLTNPLIPSWSRPRLLGGMHFQDTFEALRAALAGARKLSPDILVLVAHQGWREWGDDRANNINAIARCFPDFDLIIGAHTHQAVKASEVSRIVYTQSGSHAFWLGRVDLLYDDRARKLKKIAPALVPVEGSLPPDAALEALVEADIRAAKQHLGRKIGENRRELTADAGRCGQSGVQTLIAVSLAEAAGVEVVLHGALSQASLPAGAIRMADVWRIMPYENTIGKANLTMAEIREILEENAGYFGKTQFRGVCGITYSLDRSAPRGARVSRLRLSSGRAPGEAERIAFAVNSYDLASAGGRFPRLREIMEGPAAGLIETDLDAREAVAGYIRRHSPLEIETAPGAAIKHGPAANHTSRE